MQLPNNVLTPIGSLAIAVDVGNGVQLLVRWHRGTVQRMDAVHVAGIRRGGMPSPVRAPHLFSAAESGRSAMNRVQLKHLGLCGCMLADGGCARWHTTKLNCKRLPEAAKTDTPSLSTLSTNLRA